MYLLIHAAVLLQRNIIIHLVSRSINKPLQEDCSRHRRTLNICNGKYMRNKTCHVKPIRWACIRTVMAFFSLFLAFLGAYSLVCLEYTAPGKVKPQVAHIATET